MLISYDIILRSTFCHYIHKLSPSNRVFKIFCEARFFGLYRHIYRVIVDDCLVPSSPHSGSPLDADNSRYIADHDIYSDDVMTFISTDMRLDRLQDFEVLPNLFRVAFDDNQNGIMVVFTHEWMLDQAMYSKIETLCQFALKYHYHFVTDF